MFHQSALKLWQINFCCATALCLLLCNPALVYAEEVVTAQVVTFEKDVYPILRAHCFDCHGAIDEPEGGLDLRLVKFMKHGGDSGPAFVAGKAPESLLVERLRSGEMPPGEAKLSEKEIATFERWIADGALTARPEPETIGPGVPITLEERSWWAFQPIQRPEIPKFQSESRVRTPIDALLLKAMPEGLSFSKDADRRILMLRVYLDLTGLPPTPAEVAQFMADESLTAYEKLVDQLLQSPHYGERWGRHWLDIAGYADSEGRTTKDAVRSWTYKYRDYVVASLNTGKPFDRFLHEQLAGDELAGVIQGDMTPEQIELLTATGFLRAAADGTGSGDNSEAARNQVIADTIKIVSSSLMGLSVACAQCHDHRYDPITHTDYYAMRAVFEPALDWKKWKTPPQRFVSLYTQADRDAAAKVEVEAKVVTAERAKKQEKYMADALELELKKHEEPLREQLKTAYKTPVKERTEEQKSLLKKNPSVNITPGNLYQYNQKSADDLKADSARIAKIREKKPKQEFLRVLTEPVAHVPETKLFHRGDYRQPRQTIPPGAMTVLSPLDSYQAFPVNDPEFQTTGRRLAFARWLTGSSNPITSRVLVNRIWMHIFGKGLVNTPADFGRLGAIPSHPELLDWLASEFMTNEWDLKQLQRTMVLSTAYRQSSFREPAKEAIDKENNFYWRKPITRLDAEIVRDRVLAASGRLDRSLGGVPITVKEDDSGQVVVSGENRRRSLYLQQRRSQPVAMLQAFDAPVMETNCERRPSSTVATQSLMLMNGNFILDQSKFLSERIMKSELSIISEEFASRLPTLLPPQAPLWQFGYGSFDEAASRTGSFTELPHWNNGTWQGSAERPDPQTGWAFLTATGGHTGNNPDFAPIRRFRVPRAGELRISGSLNHPSENGDGVRGRIVSSQSGLLGEWSVKHQTVETSASTIKVQAGETIDFITDCIGNVTSDSFNWSAEVVLSAGNDSEKIWKTTESFHGPVSESEQLRIDHLAKAWEFTYCRPPSHEELELAIEFINTQVQTMNMQVGPLPKGVSPSQQALTNLCQALLTSNEFLYVE